MTVRVLVTGHAGFIGFHLAARLLKEGAEVTGIDSFNPYYDPALKHAREALLAGPGFRAVHDRIEAPGVTEALMAEVRPEIVVHLAAQAGVRHSIEAPRAYVDANLLGTFAVLEAARAHPPRHLLLASSSSVYGANPLPWREADRCASPLSFYAATKLATEAMAHSHAHIHELAVTMLRFFTVYGPWGRPDMAPALFATAILEDRPIRLFNGGAMHRDFTYVADVVEAVRRLIDRVPAPGDEGASAVAPYRIVNVGNGAPVDLADFVAAIEAAAGRPARREALPMQAGDVTGTWADTTLLERLTGFRPATPLADGVAATVAWVRDHMKATA